MGMQKTLTLQMGYEQYKLEKTKINDGDVMDTNINQVAQNSSEILTERLKECQNGYMNTFEN